MFGRKRQSAVTRPVEVLGRPFTCHVCQGTGFYSRPVQLNTAGLTFMDLDWLNRSADGVTCAGCGYVHLFFGEMHRFVD